MCTIRVLRLGLEPGNRVGRHPMLESLARRAGVASREEKWLYERLFPHREGQSVLDVGASRRTDLARRTGSSGATRTPSRSRPSCSPAPPSSLGRFRASRQSRQTDAISPFPTAAAASCIRTPWCSTSAPAPSRDASSRSSCGFAVRGFVTTPNWWFPIESQSRLPLLHWLPLPLTWPLAR